MKGVPRPQSEVIRVRQLVKTGLSDYEIARRTGVPRSTVLNWRHGRRSDKRDSCDRCGAIHTLEALDRAAYSYLLAQYLGDGCLWQSARTGTRLLRISSDAQYTGIIAECCRAIVVIRGRPPYVRYHQDKRLATITSYWRGWPCLFPQHGPGRKHHRPIFLAPWQQEIVDAEPEMFLRGLIHSDGWRGMNRVHVKGRDYEYPRYQFSNRSEDIKRMFTDTCDRLGIAWRPWGPYHISVARRASVSRLDEFIGPKW
jgi:transcriptional regulator with XRE-family HTH domain